MVSVRHKKSMNAMRIKREGCKKTMNTKNNTGGMHSGVDNIHILRFVDSSTIRTSVANLYHSILPQDLQKDWRLSNSYIRGIPHTWIHLHLYSSIQMDRIWRSNTSV